MSTDFESSSVEVERIDDLFEVRVQGAISDDATVQVRTSIAGALEGGAERILVEFQDVDYISSSGIGMLVSMLKRCHQAGVEFALSGLNANIRELFHLTRLDQIFTMVANRAAWEQNRPK